jgi:formylmethanofuran dehydrogenase subunit E
MPVSFWETFFDNDHRQRRDINDARADAAYVAADLETLRGQVIRLQRQLGDLSVLVSVLVRVLQESGGVDPQVLRYRVEAEIENLAIARGERVYAEPPPPAHIANPPEPQAPTVPTTCTKCGQTVPANRTTITEAGVVCDGCAR